MNKHFYRIIFNKARGMLMVVAEIVKSHQGTSRSSQKAVVTVADKNVISTLSRLTFMTYVALGMISITGISYANTIVVDKNADKTQRPIIMPTANGATQVNITAPSGAGVSHNKFTQFDVSEKGVILNNSHKASQTELAGYIKGNDLLLKSGSAKVILNEINSKHASQLNGYIEVAGQKAQVVVANAAGITCNGCGFINANRATLTTGKPILENGELKGYLVEQGNITINGKGLNSTKQDYTDLIAQTVNINASLWANDVKVVAGRNKVNQDVSQITKLTDNDQAPPQLAIDVAALGGMYAGKIQLVGTQTGVGVHNSGQLGASAGNITITADGKIVNSGEIYSDNDIQLNNTQNIINKGKIGTKHGQISIETKYDLLNDGAIVANKDIIINSSSVITTGKIGSINENIVIKSEKEITNRGSIIADQNIIFNSQGNINNLEGIIASDQKNLSLNASQNLNNQAILISNQTTHLISGYSLNNDGTIQSKSSLIDIKSGGNVTNNGEIIAEDKINIVTKNNFINKKNIGSLHNKVTIDANNIVNSNNIIANTSLSINSATEFKNSGDLVSQNENINIHAYDKISNFGQIVAFNHASIQTNQSLENQGSINAINGLLNINAKEVNNQGQLYSDRVLSILTKQGSLENTGNIKSFNSDIAFTINGDVNNNGDIVAKENLSLSSEGKLLNKGKLGSETGSVSISLSDSLDNQDLISASSELSIISKGALKNRGHILSKLGELKFDFFNEIYNSGSILAKNSLFGKTQDSIINDGTIGTFSGEILIQAKNNIENNNIVHGYSNIGISTDGKLINKNNIISEQGNIAIIIGDQFSNNGELIAENHLTINSKGNITNSGTLGARNGNLQLASQASFNNQIDSLILSSQDLSILSKESLKNHGTILAQKGGLFIDVGANIDNAGDLHALANIKLHSTDTIINNSHIKSDEGNIVLSAEKNIEHLQGTINSGQDISVISGHKIINDSLIYAGRDAALSADEIMNKNDILAQQNLIFTAKNLNNVGTLGAGIASDGVHWSDSGNLIINIANKIESTGNQIAAKNVILISNIIDLNNGRTEGENITLNANKGSIELEQTNIIANQELIITSTSQINNIKTKLAATKTDIQADAMTFDSRSEITADNLFIKVTKLLENKGLINGEDVQIDANQINNLGSGRIYGSNIAIQTDTLNNLDSNNVSATIAARELLRIGSKSINNTNHSLIYSDGHLMIGRELSDTGIKNNTDILVNHASTIEATKDLTLQVNQINNYNNRIETELQEVSRENIVEYQFSNSPKRYDQSEVRFEHDEVSYLCVIATGNCNDYYYKYSYERVVNEDVVTKSDPSKILAGGNMFIKAEHILNDNSQIISGGLLSLDTLGIDNIAIDGQRVISDIGNVTYFYRIHKKGSDSQGSSNNSYLPENTVEIISITPSIIKEKQIINGSGLDIDDIFNSKTTNPSLNLKSTSTNDPTLDTTSSLNENNTAVNVGNNDGTIITLNNPSIVLPSLSSIYKINKELESHYFIETDSKFTNKKDWLSSDFMFNQLKSDPNNILKRLGDGYYEQKLIREQIIELTAKRYLDGYNSDEEQYRALMSAGIRFSEQYNLKVGVSLTAEQMSSLTTDIVWMVAKTITLPDGSVVEALIPQVYVVVGKTNILGSGAIVSGNNIDFTIKDDLNNSGKIIANNGLKIDSQSILNNKGSTILADNIQLNAKKDINNLGGNIIATNNLSLSAGDNINITSTLNSNQKDNSNSQFSHNKIDSIGALITLNDNARMSLNAGNNININAAKILGIGTKNDITLNATNDINISAIETKSELSIYFDQDNYTKTNITTDIGSSIINNGNITVNAGNNVKLKGSSISATDSVIVEAGHSITVEDANQTVDYESHVKTKGKSGGGTKQTLDMHSMAHNDTSIGSSIEGKAISLNAQNDMSITGSQIMATNAVNLNSGNDLKIESGEEAYYNYNQKIIEKSGLMSSGGIGFTVGKEKSNLKQTDTEHAYQGSTIGSTEGNVNISAGKDIHVIGSDIIAKKDINLTGDNVSIDFNDAQTTYKEEYKYEKSGLTVAITGTAAEIYDAIQAMERAKEKGNDKLLALQSIKSGLTGVQAMQDLVLKNKEGQTEASIGVSLMAGTQKTEREVNQEQHSVIGSGVSAGQNITITATGNAQKEEGDITLKGSEVRAGNDITLDANRDLNVIGAVNTQHSDSDEKSYGGAVGIQFQIGGDESGFRFKGNANFSRERENADGSAWSESVINAGNTLTTKTGNDTTIIGGQVNGDTIKMDVGNNLNIQSLQDTDNYDYDKISASVSGSGGMGGFSANLALSKTDIESNWASVTDQSGIFAGKGGFDITVGNNTDLQGAVIASSAEDKTHNQLDTGTISFSNIENKADFDVSSMSMSIGTSGGPSPTAGMPTIYHNSGRDHSTTASAVEDGSLTVRNEDEQQQNINQLSRDTANANNPLAQLFNKQKELDKIEAIELVRDIAAQAKSIANKYDRIQAQNQVDKSGIDEQSVIKARDELGPDATEQQVNSLAYSYAVDKQVINNQKPDNPDNKNIGGMGSSLSKGIDAATSIVTGLITGDITGGLAGASAPYLAEQIKLATGHEDPKTGEWKTDDKAANLTAHALLGAAIAIAQGNSALAGGAGALAGEAAADFIREKLYNKDVKDLSEAEKENISALAQLAVGLAVAAGTGGNTNDVGTAVAGSKNAVENNNLAAVVIQVMKPSQTIAAPVTMTLADYLGLTLSQAEIATVLNSMTVEEKIFLQTKLSDGGVTAQEYVDVLKDKYTNAAQSSDGSSNDNSDSQASAGTQTGSNTVGGGASLPPDDDDDKEKSKTDDNSQSSNSSRDNEQFRQDTQDSWDKGSFDSPEGSLDYHFNKHGREVGATTPQQYLRKATEFAKNLKGAKKVDIKGATGNVTRYYKNGKYIDMVGKKIISFGKQ